MKELNVNLAVALNGIVHIKQLLNVSIACASEILDGECTLNWSVIGAKHIVKTGVVVLGYIET